MYVSEFLTNRLSASSSREDKRMRLFVLLVSVSAVFSMLICVRHICIYIHIHFYALCVCVPIGKICSDSALFGPENMEL